MDESGSEDESGESENEDNDPVLETDWYNQFARQHQNNQEKKFFIRWNWLEDQMKTGL